MILDEYVEITWQAPTKNYYVGKGYVFTKMGDKFNVKVIDLSPYSSVNINVRCDVIGCNNEKSLSYNRYNKNINNGGYYACSHKCARNKFIKTSLDKYGYENPAQSQEIKNKTKATNLKNLGVEYPQQSEFVRNKKTKTNLKRYGTKCALQNEDVKNKTKISNLEKYGTEHPLQSNVIKNKIIETNLEKYGTEYGFQNEDVKNKIKYTILEKYGVEFITQNEEIKNKTKLTNLEKYGTEYVLQNEKIKNKMKATNLEKYGTENPMLLESVKNKIKHNNLKKYGVEYPSQLKENREKAIKTTIERYGEIWSKNIPSYNPNSIIYLGIISKLLGLNIQHALNAGEKKFHRYWVDGYIEGYNLCIEWNERHHYGKIKRMKDFKRYKYIYENFGCLIYEINEKEFLKDPENNIMKIVEEIREIISL